MGLHSVLMSPMAFPAAARPVDPAAGAQQPTIFTAVPNFAFELAARRTTDEDMAGLDLASVHTDSLRRRAGARRDDPAIPGPVRGVQLPGKSLKPSYGWPKRWYT